MSCDQIRSAIAPLRQSLLEHPLYRDLNSPAALRTFMEFHVFAVWDFMSLLKSLQRQLCSVTVPWLPTATATAGRLINEIVLGEETDSDGQGGFASHFDLYRRSMQAFGAQTSTIDRFVALLRANRSVDEALRSAEVAEPVQCFVRHTFATINSGDLCRIASAFTFGREDLLPDVFQQIVDQLDRQSGGGLAEFKYYLARHIELDSNEHGPLASRLVSEQCGHDPMRWRTAENAAIASLEARKTLWDAIHRAIRAAS